MNELKRRVDLLLRPVAKKLDAGKMELLGIRNTMQLAKRYNTFLYGPYQQARITAYRDRLEQLFRDNGSVPDSTRNLHVDGFALDTSMSLPYLEELLTEADQVIEERGGISDVDDRYRAFFRNIIQVRDLNRWPSFLNFITSSEALAPVCHYLGMIPALSKTLPTGVRFVESGKHLDELSYLPPRDSQVFHIDPYDHPMVYVIVLLRDCGAKSGPFTWLPDSVSQDASNRLNYWSKGRPYRLEDEEIYSAADPEQTQRLIYPRGTVLYIDTSRCFHYGSRNGEEPRFQMMYGLTSVCRSDFSESYMPSFDYPLKPADSELRRMVLDRRYLP
ncbi:MAG: hypothetical protein KC800_19900 [Candidatus Eremiobacteraeota bacterium]|nr:hypothetical protein [Candidatus Eremiobacteraeota bacterium]